MKQLEIAAEISIVWNCSCNLNKWSFHVHVPIIANRSCILKLRRPQHSRIFGWLRAGNHDFPSRCMGVGCTVCICTIALTISHTYTCVCSYDTSDTVFVVLHICSCSSVYVLVSRVKCMYTNLLQCFNVHMYKFCCTWFLFKFYMFILISCYCVVSLLPLSIP